jgi:methionine synthase II (cobalamin-independent)
MTFATGVGSMPGDDQPAFDDAVRLILEELPDLPHLPELPGRGVTAGMTGHGLAVLASLGADLQPSGWRLTDAPGVDHRRARSLLGQDLDGLEEHAEGYTGAFKIQVVGPWTLAATVEKPRGDKVLSDNGARRELAQALAEGARLHLADLKRRVPAGEWIVQLDEPALPAVLAGSIPTASGFGRHRSVDRPEASEHLAVLTEAIRGEGATPWLHACAPDTPLDLVRGAGVSGLVVDVAVLGPEQLDQLGEALEAGETVALGLVPSLQPETRPSDAQLAERVLRLLDMLGLDPEEVSDQLVVTTACGLAGATPTWAREALALSGQVARALS